MKRMKLQAGFGGLRSGDKYHILAFLFPLLSLFVFGGIIPIIYSFIISLSQYKLNVSTQMRFIGLDNYVEMFSDPVFLGSIWKTLYYSVLMITLSMFFGLMIALVVNRNFIGKGIFMIVLLLPWAIPKAASGIMWKWILEPSFGIFNMLLMSFGLIHEKVYWFNIDAITAINFVIFVDVWKSTPFVVVMLLAALKAVPKELYESAKCDGANYVQSLFFITLPRIKFTLVMVMMLQSIWALKIFDLLYVLTPDGGVNDMTTLVYMYVYKQAFKFMNIGYGTAIAYFMTFIIMLIAILYVKIILKEERP
ncbi:MAG: carbohydrate ABC transporter permease [Saccharofermentanales bacterium]|jgi:multiple sugar transport system permease protein